MSMTFKKRLADVATIPYTFHLKVAGALVTIGFLCGFTAEQMGYDVNWLNTALSAGLGSLMTLAAAIWAKRSLAKKEVKLSFNPSPDRIAGGWMCKEDVEHHARFFGAVSFPNGRKTPTPIEVLESTGSFGFVHADYLDTFPPESQWHHEIQAYKLKHSKANNDSFQE